MGQPNKKEILLDEEERDLKKSLDSLDLESIKKPSKDRQADLKRAAANYSKKDAKMNIRIGRAELDAIKQRAEEEGLKYQPFIRSILHRYMTGRLVDPGKLRERSREQDHGQSKAG